MYGECRGLPLWWIILVCEVVWGARGVDRVVLGRGLVMGGVGSWAWGSTRVEVGVGAGGAGPSGAELLG